MEVFEKIKPLQERLTQLERKKIGFVPTMGALHKGHLSLVERSAKENDVTVVSIFVNPTQFNDKNDLKNYPRDLEKDIELLSDYKCILFTPDESEIYPEEDTRIFDFDGIDKVMEGEFRPGHFNGVAQVVTRLFDIVKPNKAYFGIKDFQQVAIIKKVVKNQQVPVEIITCPTVREKDGLAMSSRNMRLSGKQRELAPVIAKTLLYVKNNIDKIGEYQDVKEYVKNALLNLPDLKTEYFQIVNEDSLKEISSLKKPEPKVACIAVWIGNVRLIDNVKLN